MIKIAASILGADFSKLGDEIKKVENAGVDMIHFDIMDGHFVPNITFGKIIVDVLRDKTKLPFDIHLMIENADTFIPSFIEGGADIITVHYEAVVHLQKTISVIKNQGIKAAVALNPATPLCSLDYILEDLDMVLLMSVNPGFTGQEFIPETLRKIKELKNIFKKRKIDIPIQVDGGINEKNSSKIISSGADILVATTVLFKSGDLKSTIRKLKGK